MSELFSDHPTSHRDVTFPFRLSQKERDFLHSEARRQGVRDATTLLRRCIRDQLLK